MISPAPLSAMSLARIARRICVGCAAVPLCVHTSGAPPLSTANVQHHDDALAADDVGDPRHQSSGPRRAAELNAHLLHAHLTDPLRLLDVVDAAAIAQRHPAFAASFLIELVVGLRI